MSMYLGFSSEYLTKKSPRGWRTKQYLFEIVLQRGCHTHFALCSYGIEQVSLRYPFCMGGYRTSSAHAKGVASHPISSYGDTHNPTAQDIGVSLR